MLSLSDSFEEFFESYPYANSLKFPKVSTERENIGNAKPSDVALLHSDTLILFFLKHGLTQLRFPRRCTIIPSQCFALLKSFREQFEAVITKRSLTN